MLLFLSSLNLSMPMWDFLKRWGSDHLSVILPLVIGTSLMVFSDYSTTPTHK